MIIVSVCQDGNSNISCFVTASSSSSSSLNWDIRSSSLKKKPGMLYRGGASWRVPPSTSTSKTSSSSSTRLSSSSSSEKEEENALSSETISAFLTRDNRNTFIARVYAILTGQLLMTCVSIYIFHMFPQVSQWMKFNQGGKIGMYFY